MFYNYVLQSKNSGKLYVGYAIDLRKRLKEHNQGLSQSTKPYRPWILIYYEACLNEQDAKRRERYLKTTQGQRLLKRRLKDYFYSQKSTTGYAELQQFKTRQNFYSGRSALPGFGI